MASNQKDLYCTLLTILALADGDVSPSELYFINSLFDHIKPTVKLDWGFIESVSKKDRAKVLQAFKVEIYANQKYGFFLIAEMFILAIIHNNIDENELTFIKEVAAAFRVEEKTVNELTDFAKSLLSAIHAADQKEFEFLIKMNLPEFGYIPACSVFTGMVAGAVAGSAFSPVGSVVGAFCGVFANSIRTLEFAELKHLIDLYKDLIVCAEAFEANSLNITLFKGANESLEIPLKYSLMHLVKSNSYLEFRGNEYFSSFLWKKTEFVSKKNRYCVGNIDYIENDFDGIALKKPNEQLIKNFLIASEVLIVPILSKYSMNLDSLSKNDKKQAFSFLKINHLKDILRIWTKGNLGKKFDGTLVFVLVDAESNEKKVISENFKECVLTSPYAGLIEVFSREGGKEPLFVIRDGCSGSDQEFIKQLSEHIFYSLLNKSRALSIKDENSFAGFLMKRPQNDEKVSVFAQPK